VRYGRLDNDCVERANPALDSVFNLFSKTEEYLLSPTKDFFCFGKQVGD